MNRPFWKDKRVFLTGHTGFKGSWLSLWLESAGARVTGFALPPPSEPSLFTEAAVSDGMRSIEGDVRDLTAVRDALQQSEAEIVLHLAAQSLVRRSYEDPVETYATNVIGTAHVLEAVRRTPGVKALVSCTSDKCYENKEWDRGYREDDRLGGKDPYSNSKACAELVTDAFRRSYFSGPETEVAVASVRSGNVIGGGDWARDRLIPDLVGGFLAGEEVPIRSPDAVRPWQHVLEPLNGYLELAEHLWEGGREYAEAWNFGPEREDARPVRWIAEHLAEIWGDGARWRIDDRPHPPEATYLKLDSSKARARLGWRPRLDLSTALDWLASWYLEHRQGRDARELCRRRIEDFEARAA